MIAGFEDISSGEIYIDQTKINTLAPKDRDIAMVFQNYALYPHMTVFDNMAFALKLRKVYMPVTTVDEENPEYQNEITDCESRYEELIQDTVAKMKAEKAPKDEIKSFVFRTKANLYSELEAIDAKYESPVMTFDSKKTQELEKQIAELKKESPVDETKLNELKEDLEKEYNTLETPAYSYRHYTAREIAAKVNETAKILGLEPYLKRKPAALSGGQRQRVALGRAIVRKPKVFLMDEPLSNLDAKLRVQTRSEIIKIHNKVGATTIYVTHDQTEAMTMASRIVIMRDGVVQQIGTPKEVYEKPSNMFVAGFIGSPSMNFLKGTFDGKSFKLVDSNIKIDLSQKNIELLKDYVGDDVILGIRPEHIFAASDKSLDNKSSVFEVKCEISELLGSEMIVYGEIAEQKVLMKISSKYNVQRDENIQCVFDDDAVHFFDNETKEAIF